MRQLSSAPEGQSVSNSWFSPQRSGGEVQEFAAQLPHSPRAERGENEEISRSAAIGWIAFVSAAFIKPSTTQYSAMSLLARADRH